MKAPLGYSILFMLTYLINYHCDCLNDISSLRGKTYPIKLHTECMLVSFIAIVHIEGTAHTQRNAHVDEEKSLCQDQNQHTMSINYQYNSTSSSLKFIVKKDIKKEVYKTQMVFDSTLLEPYNLTMIYFDLDTGRSESFYCNDLLLRGTDKINDDRAGIKASDIKIELISFRMDAFKDGNSTEFTKKFKICSKHNLISSMLIGICLLGMLVLILIVASVGRKRASTSSETSLVR